MLMKLTMSSNCERMTCGIDTKDGPVRGLVERRDGCSYYKFKRIPYAKPPVGCLRFLPPSPIQSWINELDCTEDAPVPFRFTLNHEIEGSEDCLYIEISTPDIKPDKPLPVMFWMSCYCFNRNIDNYLDPVFLNNENVLFIRCGYRLGPFGFISIKNIMAPGNCGLKDLVMALKWVQRNIGAFGGDPDNVTIFGNGAGGPLVHYMMLSPMASGLFHKAIVQSASALNNWCLTKNSTLPLFELAKVLGITKTCEIEVIEELRCMPAQTIMEAYFVLDRKSCDVMEYDLLSTPFKPCIEEEFEGQPAFLAKSPALIIKSGNFNKVPLIIGCNNIEANVIEYVSRDFYNDFQKYNENVEILVPKALLTNDAKLLKNIGQRLLKFYLGGEEILTKDTRVQLLQLFTDYYFLYYINKTIRLHSQFMPNHQIFYYVIHYAGEWDVPEDLNMFNTLGHGAETAFIFGIKMPSGLDNIFKGSRDSVKTRSRIVKMWTNFAKYGNPTPEEDQLLQIKWDPVENKDKLNYLSIGQELTKGTNPFYDRMEFWDELHKEYTFLRAHVYFNDIGVTW